MQTLKADGHTCEEAEDGKVAVEKVAAADLDKFHVILMDFVMPVMDGPDATKAIRDLGYTRPVIGCTGNTLEMDLKRFHASGCNGVIGKPFVLDLFYQYMEEHAAMCMGEDGLSSVSSRGVGAGEVGRRPASTVVALAQQWGLTRGGSGNKCIHGSISRQGGESKTLSSLLRGPVKGLVGAGGVGAKGGEGAGDVPVGGGWESN